MRPFMGRLPGAHLWGCRLVRPFMGRLSGAPLWGNR